MITEFVDVAVNTILFQRRVYPSAAFNRFEIYDTNAPICIHPMVRHYMVQIVDSSHVQLCARKLKQLVLVLQDAKARPLEKFIFDVTLPSKKVSLVPVGGNSVLSLEKTFKQLFVELEKSLSTSSLEVRPSRFSIQQIIASDVKLEKPWRKKMRVSPKRKFGASVPENEILIPIASSSCLLLTMQLLAVHIDLDDISVDLSECGSSLNEEDEPVPEEEPEPEYGEGWLEAIVYDEPTEEEFYRIRNVEDAASAEEADFLAVAGAVATVEPPPKPVNEGKRRETTEKSFTGFESNESGQNEPQPMDVLRAVAAVESPSVLEANEPVVSEEPRRPMTPREHAIAMGLGVGGSGTGLPYGISPMLARMFGDDHSAAKRRKIKVEEPDPGTTGQSDVELSSDSSTPILFPDSQPGEPDPPHTTGPSVPVEERPWTLPTDPGDDDRSTSPILFDDD